MKLVCFQGMLRGTPIRWQNWALSNAGRHFCLHVSIDLSSSVLVHSFSLTALFDGVWYSGEAPRVPVVKVLLRA